MVRINLSAINNHGYPEVPLRVIARRAADGVNVIINDVPELIELLNTQVGYYTVGIIDPGNPYRQRVISLLRVNESIDRGDFSIAGALLRGCGGLALTALIILSRRIRV